MLFCSHTKEFIAATGTATSASNSLLNVDTIPSAGIAGVDAPDIVSVIVTNSPSDRARSR